MIESKGELKYKKIDDLTLEVCDDNECKLWTLETLEHSMIQIAKDREVADEKDEIRKEILDRYAEYYENLIEKAGKLGILTREELKKREEAAKPIKTNKKKHE